MDPRGYVGVKKAGAKFTVGNPRKKFTAPSFVDKSKQRNYKQLSQEEQIQEKKAYRINSVNKQTRAGNGQLNYGISGLSYLKKKEFEQYDYDIEESKLHSKYSDNYMLNKQRMDRRQGYEEGPTSNDDKFDEHIDLLSQKVQLLEQKLMSRDLEIKRVKIQNQRLLIENEVSRCFMLITMHYSSLLFC